MKVLVVNAGSSSLKYQLLDTETEALLAKGICERIGETVGILDHRKYTNDGGEEKEIKFKEEVVIPNHSVATRMVVDALTDPVKGVIKSMDEIEAVGHRVVHGGPYFFESTLVTPEVIDKLRLCVDFAPLHTIPHIMGIEGVTEVMPDKPQVLVFDTAFHTTIPEYAST